MVEEMLNQFIDEICIVELENGRVFCSRLVQIDNDEVWFMNRRGQLIMNRRDKICRIYKQEKVDTEEEPEGVIEDVQDAEERSVLYFRGA